MTNQKNGKNISYTKKKENFACSRKFKSSSQNGKYDCTISQKMIILKF